MSQVDLKLVRRPAEAAVAAGVVWLAGISPVPGVYLEPDPARRLTMLRKGQRPWVVGQHVAAAGTAAMPAASHGGRWPSRAGIRGGPAKTGDIPPFVFYVAEQLAAASFLHRKGPASR